MNGDVTDYVKSFVNKEDTSEYKTIDAPTQSLLQKWLREDYAIHIEIIPNEKDPKNLWVTIVYPLYFMKEPSNEGTFKTYELALENGLIEGLKLI